uniref:protein FAM53B-like n=1 Tax=Oncorhynchus gorbuscha TaxID=8017 RepID=UPI001EAF83D6|nr:protein FAM53B-like [Oncorhynchus gorbuscha]XP_046194507.1 protein FAM53B-like [Oncorhynchus gorbuscha]
MWAGVAMVIIYTKLLEKKPGVNDVKSKVKETHLELIKTETMSLQGTALFSYGVMDTGSRWGDVGLGRGCCGALPHQRPSVESCCLENLWDVLPSEVLPLHYYPSPVRDTGLGPASITSIPGAITGLLQDLSLGETSAAVASSPSTAPPSKRQCRSVSCSEDLGGRSSAWRPQGSGVWTAVAKRRSHSGGSVQRGFATGGGTRSQQLGFPAMQRSFSFSLPARSNTLSLDLTGFTPCPSYFSGLAPPSYSSRSSEPPRPFLYLSREQICLPEMKRRAGQGGLARSRSQPCVLSDKKTAMKRRRPADSHKQRPSLDLTKMTQKLRNFQSLSCPGITGDNSYQSTQGPPPLRTTDQCETDFTSAGDQGLDEPTARVVTGVSGEEDPAISIEELDWLSSPVCDDVAEGAATGTRKDVYQLGGDLDIDQIERN